MSHFTTLKTQLIEVSHIVKALGDLGFHQIEVHEVTQPLFGYQGDRRSQTAEIIIRRQFVGQASNDIGFKLQSNHTFNAIISEFDRTLYSQQWLDKLSQRYAYHTSLSKLVEQG